MGREVPPGDSGKLGLHLSFGMGWVCGGVFLEWSMEWIAIAQETLFSRPTLSRVLE